MLVRYPPAALVPDALRALGGVVLAGAPLVLMETAPIATAALGILVVLFALFACQIWRRFRTRIEVDGEGVRSLPRGPAVRWEALQSIRLSWFSLRREAAGRGFASLRSRRAEPIRDETPHSPRSAKGQGWLELKLGAQGAVIRMDSRIAHFASIVEMAVQRAQAAGIELDAASLANLDAVRETDPKQEGVMGLRA